MEGGDDTLGLIEWGLESGAGRLESGADRILFVCKPHGGGWLKGPIKFEQNGNPQRAQQPTVGTHNNDNIT